MIDLDVTDFTVCGKCSRCGSCCGVGLPFTKKEGHVIRRFLETHDVKPSNLSWQTGDTLVCICPFLDMETHRCQIYEARPFVCRNFLCCKKEETLRFERDMYAVRADFNSFCVGNRQLFMSFQYAFYGDWAFDVLYRHKILGEFAKSIPNLSLSDFDFDKEREVFPLYVDRYLKVSGDTVSFEGDPYAGPFGPFVVLK